jgi:hypothetical protein
MSKLLFVALLAFSAAAAQAQAPTRVRGIVATSDGKAISVREAGGRTTEIHLGEKTEYVFTQPIPLSEIKSGDFLGVTSMKRADGTLTAVEVRRFPKPLNPGHRPFDGRDDQTMTNATVEATVQGMSGRELTMKYEGGAQKIMVPESASVSTLVPGNRAQLVPGALVNLTAAPAADGRFTALRIQISKPQ